MGLVLTSIECVQCLYNVKVNYVRNVCELSSLRECHRRIRLDVGHRNFQWLRVSPMSTIRVQSRAARVTQNSRYLYVIELINDLKRFLLLHSLSNVFEQLSALVYRKVSRRNCQTWYNISQSLRTKSRPGWVYGDEIGGVMCGISFRIKLYRTRRTVKYRELTSFKAVWSQIKWKNESASNALRRSSLPREREGVATPSATFCLIKRVLFGISQLTLMLE